MLLFTISWLLIGVSSADAVCYGKYGCFSRWPPFNNRLVWLPEGPAAVRTTFNLYTSYNKVDAKLINDDDEKRFRSSSFDVSKRTILIIHGFIESKKGWPTRMKRALLEREDCNVILVDWSKGAKFPYAQAAGNTRLVGAQTAELIMFLISSTYGTPDLAENFYIVGFSLGAVIAGYAGSYLKARGMMLGRITGLDPAGPYFSYTNPAVRLDPGDAHFVDVIHTDAGLLGTSQNVGHIDFYPNGGSRQPGCHFSLTDIVKSVACQHMRAPEYYISSVQNHCPWKGFPCKNYRDFKYGRCQECDGECPYMGYKADHTKQTGTFYLKTSSKAPFCA